LRLGRGALFHNRIEAWEYGPVIPDLYRATKEYGRNPIPWYKISDEEASLDEATRRFLQSVYDIYKKFIGIQLSYLTHKSGTPWDKVYQSGVLNLEIPNELIKDHYEQIDHERKSAA